MVWVNSADKEHCQRKKNEQCRQAQEEWRQWEMKKSILQFSVFSYQTATSQLPRKEWSDIQVFESQDESVSFEMFLKGRESIGSLENYW